MQAEQQLAGHQDRRAAKDDEVRRTAEIASQPEADVRERLGEIGHYVARADGQLDVPPAPQSDHHDERLGNPGVRHRGLRVVAADAVRVLVDGEQHRGAEVAEEDVGEQTSDVLGPVRQLALQRAAGNLPVEPHAAHLSKSGRVRRACRKACPRTKLAPWRSAHRLSVTRAWSSRSTCSITWARSRLTRSTSWRATTCWCRMRASARIPSRRCTRPSIRKSAASSTGATWRRGCRWLSIATSCRGWSACACRRASGGNVYETSTPTSTHRSSSASAPKAR